MLKRWRDGAELAWAKLAAFVAARLPTGDGERPIDRGLSERIALEVIQEFESHRLISHVRVGCDAGTRHDLVDCQAAIAIEVNTRLYAVRQIGRLPGALPVKVSIAAPDELSPGEIKSYSADDVMGSALEPATGASSARSASFGLRDRDTGLQPGGILGAEQPIEFFTAELLGMHLPGDPVPLGICWDGRTFGVVGRRVEVEPAVPGVLRGAEPTSQDAVRRVQEGDVIRIVLAPNLVRSFEFMLPDEGVAGAR